METEQLNLRHLRAVVAIARTGSLSAAAREVHLSQPAITQGLVELERKLGAALFDRHPRGMMPTPSGAALVVRAGTALNLVGSARVTRSELRAFAALARCGSYKSAALELGIREPTLHRAVADLSLALGEELVVRRGRGVALTRRGDAIAIRFRLAEVELRAAIAELGTLQGRDTGRIVIGSMPLSRAQLLPNAIVEFQKTRPQVDIRIVEGSHAELLAPLRNGEVDFLIGALRETAPGPDLVQAELFVDCPQVVGRRHHPLSWRSRVTPANLARYAWVIAAEGTPLRAQWRRMFEASGIEPPRIAVESGSVSIIRHLLMDTDYLTLLSPDQVSIELAARQLEVIGDAPGRPGRTIGLTSRTDWRPTLVQRAFLVVVHDEARQLSAKT